MIEIPDPLRSVFSATVREGDGAYVVGIPSREIDTMLSLSERRIASHSSTHLQQ